jgi:hypothetical protein
MVIGKVTVIDNLGNTQATEIASTYATTLIENLDTAIGTTYQSYSPQNTKYVIPLISVEYDALDRTIEDHASSIEEELDLQCLTQDLIAQPEFEVLFRYVFPLNRITSMMAIYVGKAFLMSIGEKTSDKTSAGSAETPTWPEPDLESGEWQNYLLRKRFSMLWFPVHYDSWDFEFLFPKTKRALVKMFRTYFKSREFLGTRDEDDYTDLELDRKEANKPKKKKRKGSRRKTRRRRRDRPFDKDGN